MNVEPVHEIVTRSWTEDKALQCQVKLEIFETWTSAQVQLEDIDTTASHDQSGLKDQASICQDHCADYESDSRDNEDSGLNDSSSMNSTAKEDNPLIEEEIKASRSEQALDDSRPDKRYLRQHMHDKITTERQRNQLKLLEDAERTLWLNSNTSSKGEDVPNLIIARIRSIFVDADRILKNIYGPSAISQMEIQRRIMEAVEHNSLKCLDFLLKKYEENPISTENDVERFHRRYGLSSWPVNERPKETALHVLATKHTSTQAMEVLENSKFLHDFSDVQDSNGSTPLLLAIKCNNIEVVKRLLPTKPDINKRNLHDETPIYIAALNDHAYVIKEILTTYSESQEHAKLLEVMKNINETGHTILYPAAQSGKSKVLNLIMEQNWWKDVLKQERNTDGFESFAYNVFTAGCTSLAKFIFEQDCSTDFRGVCLLRAVESNHEEMIHFIIENKPERGLFESDGKTVFGLAVENPKILEYLLTQFLTLSDDNELINQRSYRLGNRTAIELAAAKRQTESFKMLFAYTTDKADILSADVIHNVDTEVLKECLSNWKEKEPEAVACLLQGDYKKPQPFLEAARRGSIELMEFFLQEGANYLQRTPKGQNVIHCAVLSGKLEAVKYLLEEKKFLDINIDLTDEVNISAAGYATQAGHADILRYLLENKAQMMSDKKTARLNILDSAYGYFKIGESSINEIVEFCTQDKKSDMLEELFQDSHFGADHIMSKLIEEIPNVAMLIFNRCIIEEEKLAYRSYSELKVERVIDYRFFPLERTERDGMISIGLEAIESMVKHNREDCLGHPLVIRFLNEKMNSSSIQKLLIFNILLYTTFLITLTAYGAIQSQGERNFKSPGMIAISVIILLICALHCVKEIFQIVFSKSNYLKDFENYIEWVMYICAVIYVVPGGSTKADGQIAAGAIAVFLGWINFSLFLQRFSLFGIYIIMAKKVILTVCKVLPLVVLFIVAFSLSLSLLMPLDEGFKNVPISLLTTFVMMTGELDYRDTFLVNGTLHFLQKIFLVFFILVMSIAIMNLLTGLAVGDTNEIMNRSKEERRLYKASLVITLERSKFRRVIEEFLPDDPDKKSKWSWLFRQWQKVYGDDDAKEQLKAMANEKKGNEEHFDELKKESKKTNDNVTAVETRIEQRLIQFEENAAAAEKRIEQRLMHFEKNAAATETRNEERLMHIEEMLQRFQSNFENIASK